MASAGKYRAAACKPARREVADGGQLGCAIAYAYCQSGSSRQGNVGQVVAHVGDLFFGHSCFTYALIECVCLFSLPKINKSDLEFGSTLCHGW